jgi:hypothetical protein
VDHSHVGSLPGQIDIKDLKRLLQLRLVKSSVIGRHGLVRSRWTRGDRM